MTTNNSSLEQSIIKIKTGKNIQAQSINEIAKINDSIIKDPNLVNKSKAFVLIYGLKANKAVITYPQISSSRIFIQAKSQILVEELNLVLSEPEIVGNIYSISLRDRLLEDWKSLVIALIIFIVIFGGLLSTSIEITLNYSNYLNDPTAYQAVSNYINFYQAVGQSLVTVLTLFLSIFILFTITQNSALSTDNNLYMSGQAHKYFKDDRFVAFVCGLSLFASLIGFLLTVFPSEVIILSTNLNKVGILIPLAYSVAFAGLFICFSSLSYYSERVFVANESNLVAQILRDQSSSTRSDKS